MLACGFWSINLKRNFSLNGQDNNGSISPGTTTILSSKKSSLDSEGWALNSNLIFNIYPIFHKENGLLNIIPRPLLFASSRKTLKLDIFQTNASLALCAISLTWAVNLSICCDWFSIRLRRSWTCSWVASRQWRARPKWLSTWDYEWELVFDLGNYKK